jgi:outer membrane receptor for ferrienterochelin and colicin
MKIIKLYILITLLHAKVFAQKYGTITGQVKDRNTQELLIGATITLEGTSLGAQTDANGRFKIINIPPKSYNLLIQYVGYKPKTVFNAVVTTGNILNYNIELEPESKNLNEVVVQGRTFGKKTETPLSVQSLTAEEIRSNPGGNFDISRVIQALPGVGGSTGGAAFRNDIIIRGGGPNENVFYLDGIEIPVINHFSTQGSTGGPQGILNVSFIEDVTLSSSSFGARYDNALSSVIAFKQKEGNKERVQGNARLSASEFGLTLDGPLTNNTTFLASARRSYLQFLFQAIDLPIRPNYWDFQYKTTTRLNDKTTLTTLGVGAIDEFSFAVPKESTPEKEYAIRSNPIINQWNYTFGALVKRRINNGVLNISASRNMFENRLDRFEDGRHNEESFRVLKIRSREIENKFRLDVNKYIGNWKYSYGGVFQYVKFSNEGFTRVRNAIKGTNQADSIPALNVQLNSAIEFFRYGFFGEANRKLAGDRLSLTLGVRADGNTFTKNGNEFWRTISPRFSASYALTEQWNINATIGRYYKLPIYTVLGFRDATGNLVNKDNEYLAVNHYVAGVEFLPTNATRITVEGFFKQYNQYAVSAATGISLANQGTEFGAIGNEKTISSGKGRAYGAEVFFQQKLTKNFYTTISYTLFVSQFSGTDGRYIASAWDNRHLLSAIAGYKLPHGWEIGVKHRFAGGSPYTPFDLAASQQNYLLTGTGTFNYGDLNTLRLGGFNQTDIRVDKKFNFKRITLDIFLDIQNVTRNSNPATPQFTFQRTADNSGWATNDGKPVRQNGSNAIPIVLNNVNDTFLPTFGFIVEF